MRRITLSPSNKVVEAQAGETVLSALERAGYALPNNCRAGACGECKVKVLSGCFDQGLVLDMALSATERADGFGLMCMAKPTGDELVIEWGTADAKPKLFPPRTGQPYVVTDRIMRTGRVVELHLRPVGPAMRYWPGQYVVLGSHDAPAPRCYSIANAPRTDGEIVLQVARIDGPGTSRWIHETLQVGSVTSLDGPYGTFIGDPSVETPVLCLAAGTGLAPILALTEAALRRNYRKPVLLIISARTAADVYAQGLLAYWQRRYRNFKYRVSLTRSDDPAYLHGRIQTILPQLFTDLSEHSVFMAGSPDFVSAGHQAALALGARPDRMHSEGYFGNMAPQTPSASQLVA